MDIIDKIAAKELRFPKVGSVHPCGACGEPDIARFLGSRKGKGRWEWLREHTLEDCRKRHD
ncbi:hypothetical protein LCGC14_2244130 [marine sediment metagenome]|uniref:Uncharacterized protein n=1 Tax=marine sediment metagenome TaxID=412755 RepID=A0A0F9FZJ1_9ZZZZ